MKLKFLTVLKRDRLLRVVPRLTSQMSQHIRELPAHIPTGVKVVGLISLAMTGLVGGIEHLGGIEPLELRAYDWMMRFRPAEKPDPRLLIVTITEADIREQQQSILSDQVVAKTLAILEQHQPVAIGLDLYRDVPQPPGTAALQQQLASPRLIAITNLGSTDADFIPPPPTVPLDRVGFNDFPVDADGVVRRGLLFGGESTSFSLQLAWKYLAAQGIFSAPSPIDPDLMQLGSVTFLPLQANTGGYQTLDARGYQLLLNYRNHQPVAREISLSQVLHRQFQPEWIQGKIVLIGTTAPSRKDLFYTPFSAGQSSEHQMPGVEVHAQMLSQILSAVLDRRPLIWSIPEWMEWIWIGVWAGIAGSFAWWIRRPVQLGVTCLGMLLLLGITTVGVFQAAGWIPVISPAIAALFTVGTVVTHRAQQAHQQHQMVMTLLGQNTSKEIATALWHNRDTLINSGRLPGQRLIATMLFTDVCGFSTISESMPPEALLEWLNEYLEAMTQEIQRHQGITNKFTGDGLLAVFGVPIPRSSISDVAQDACRAVACALAMGDRLAQLNQEWQTRQLPIVQMRVGIFTGAVVAGSLGGKNRLEYGVIGDSVNIASRLESCAKDRQVTDCRILIAAETLAHIKDQFDVESWGEMALHGKHQQVQVYRVLQHHAANF